MNIYIYTDLTVKWLDYTIVLILRAFNFSKFEVNFIFSLTILFSIKEDPKCI